MASLVRDLLSMSLWDSDEHLGHVHTRTISSTLNPLPALPLASSQSLTGSREHAKEEVSARKRSACRSQRLVRLCQLSTYGPLISPFFRFPSLLPNESSTWNNSSLQLSLRIHRPSSSVDQAISSLSVPLVHLFPDTVQVSCLFSFYLRLWREDRDWRQEDVLGGGRDRKGRKLHPSRPVLLSMSSERRAHREGAATTL